MAAPSLGTFSYDPKKDISQEAPRDTRPIHLWPFGHTDTVAAPVAAPVTPAVPSVTEMSGGLVQPQAQPSAVQQGVQAMNDAASIPSRFNNTQIDPVTGADYSGLDYSRRALEEAMKRHPENVTQATHDALATANRQIGRNSPEPTSVTGIPEKGEITNAPLAPGLPKPAAPIIPLKQDLTSQAQSLYDRNKSIADSRISNNASVAAVAPGGDLSQTNYDANGNIVRSQNPEVQAKVNELLKARALTAQAQMPSFEAGHVQRYNDFKAKVDADRNMEAVQGRASTSDPTYNLQTAQLLAQAALQKDAAYGNSGNPFKYLPKQDAEYPDKTTAMANTLLQNPGMTPEEGLATMMALTPRNQVVPSVAAQDNKNAETQAGLLSGIRKNEDKIALQQAAAEAKPEYKAAKMLDEENTKLRAEITKLQGNTTVTDAQAKTIAEYTDQIEKNKKLIAKNLKVTPDLLGVSNDKDSVPETASPASSTRPPLASVIKK
jgi:hypothetical protein